LRIASVSTGVISSSCFRGQWQSASAIIDEAWPGAVPLPLSAVSG
jgi:hypothetical protein